MPQGGTPQYPERFVKLEDIHPYSDPAANVCTDDGDWGFFGEGGQVAFMDFKDYSAVSTGNALPAVNPSNGIEFYLRGEVKLVQLGALGVRPAEMRLHPDIDLSDDAIDSGPGPEDQDDLVFIAGGRLGLWVMEAHPSPNYQANKVARIDNRGTLRRSAQDSERYCNGLDFVTIDGVEYLVALFAKARANRIRFYRLSDIPGVLSAAGPDGTGGEIPPAKQTLVTFHPNAPALANYNGGANYVYSAPYASDIDVHTVNASEADIYVAMGIHGALHV